jgi:hypothetical protein
MCEGAHPAVEFSRQLALRGPPWASSLSRELDYRTGPHGSAGDTRIIAAWLDLLY